MTKKEIKTTLLRRDTYNNILNKGEYQRPNGTYQYSWTDFSKKRRCLYAKTLDALRQKEKIVKNYEILGINSEVMFLTVNDVYDMWVDTKRGLRLNTFENYKYMYNKFVRKQFGYRKISDLKKSDVKRFYNYLSDEMQLKASTIGSIHTVLHQILQFAVDDEYMRVNPSDNTLNELKRSHIFKNEKRKALTFSEQTLFMNFLKTSTMYGHWYPIFAVMLGTGMRVGEITGLRWCDVDFENNLIYINHTLVYYDHRQEGHKQGCYFGINPPKTPASKRTIPMLDFVKEALLIEKARQEQAGIKCRAIIDGYTDFIFVNRFGDTQHQGTLNKAIRRIIRDCNDAELLKDENASGLLPHFSCHNLRHTFATRLCEAEVNIKVIQDILGHSDVATTLNIYTIVTKEFKNKAFEIIESVI